MIMIGEEIKILAGGCVYPEATERWPELGPEEMEATLVEVESMRPDPPASSLPRRAKRRGKSMMISVGKISASR